jgi:hypothetical protein
MRMIPALAVALLLAAHDSTGARPDCYPRSVCKVDCEKTKDKILRIQAKMRQGYGASQGAKMEAKLRDLRKLRSRYCR